MIPPWPTPPAVGGQQRLHPSQGLVGELEHRTCARADGIQERDAIDLHRHQQQSAAAVLVTAAALTPANAADGPIGVSLLDGEAPGLEVLADTAYGGGETRAALTTAGHLQRIKPIPLRPAVPGGFTKDDFAINLHAGTVTCPAGHNVAITPGGRAVSTGAVAAARSVSAAPGPRTARQ